MREFLSGNRNQRSSSSHGNTVAAAAATASEEEGDSGPKAQAQGRQERRWPLGFEIEEGPTATTAAAAAQR